MNFLENLYGNFYLSQSMDSAMSDGRYQIVIGEKVPGVVSLASLLVPKFAPGKVYGDGKGRTITIVAVDAVPDANGHFTVTFDLVNGETGPEQAGLWAVGIFTIIGLALALLTVIEIRKLVPKETVNLILITVCIVTLFALYKLWWVKR